jgi:hypothetical protein
MAKATGEPFKLHHLWPHLSPGPSWGPLGTSHGRSTTMGGRLWASPSGPHLWSTGPFASPESKSTCPVGLSRGKERVSQVFIQKQVLPSSFSLFPYLPHLLNPSRIPPSSEHRSSWLERTPTPLSLPELIHLGHVTPWRSILLRCSRKRFAQ